MVPCHQLTWTFVLDLSMMILKYLTVMVCTDHVVNVIKISAEVPQYTQNHRFTDVM
jgi:hypothetical protein